MSQLKLIAMSVVLTLLVWVSADQLLTETVTLQVTIEPVAAAGRESFKISRAGDRPQKFQITLSGPQRTLAPFREGGISTIDLPIEARTTGLVSVKLLDALRKNRARFSGLTVDSVTPEYLEAVVDREITVSLPIWVDKGTLDYDVDPSVEPDQVEVTISERRLNAIAEEKRCLVLHVENLLRNRRKGELLRFSVPLEAKVAGIEAKVAPAQVELRATVRELHITDTIAAVPVRFTGSVDLWNEFTIELRDQSTLLTQPITVKGPAEIVARLVSGDIKVAGLITLNRDDTLDLGRYRAKKPEFALPAGVQLAEPNAVQSVEFQMVRLR
ncbi:MAG: hypothetical protein KAV82_02020 [Phycisphaerae bacterium]|nr:hypothetical protein [Phycisphaerae bacterium]